MNELIHHYDSLIDEDNDSFRDPPVLQEYMNKWDGAEFIEAMTLCGSERVLEIGIGTGRIAAKTAPLCSELYGIDISPKTIARAEENLSEYGNIRLVCNDFLIHDFAMRFDVIYSSLTFMHFEDKSAALKKIVSLLDSSGKCVLSLDKSRDEYIDMGDRRLKIYPDSAENIISCAEKAGMKLNRIFETEHAEIVVLVRNVE